MGIRLTSCASRLFSFTLVSSKNIRHTSTPYIHQVPDNYDVSYWSSKWGTSDKVFLICKYQNVPGNAVLDFNNSFIKYRFIPTFIAIF